MVSMPNGIEALIAATLKTVLTDHCITQVDADDTSKANHVIIGKPTKERANDIVVSIHMQHPLGPGADKDAVTDGVPRATNERPWRWPAEFNTRTEKIIGTVQIDTRIKESPEDAIKVTSIIKRRIERAINRDERLRFLRDDLGNFMSTIETFQSSGYSSGGGNIDIGLRWVDWRAFVHCDISRNL